METRIGQTAITCNACREGDASGYEIRLGDPTIHNTMSVSLCRSCYAEVAIVAVQQASAISDIHAIEAERDELRKEIDEARSRDAALAIQETSDRVAMIDSHNAMRRERDEARNNVEEYACQWREIGLKLQATRRDLAQRDRRIAELEAALRDVRINLIPPFMVNEDDWVSRQNDIVDAALSAPTHPASHVVRNGASPEHGAGADGLIHGADTAQPGTKRDGFGWSPICDSPRDFPCAFGATHVDVDAPAQPATECPACGGTDPDPCAHTECRLMTFAAPPSPAAPYCAHGINHSGERHGCDGCCKPSAVISSNRPIGYGNVDIPDEAFVPGAVRRMVSEDKLTEMERVIEAARELIANLRTITGKGYLTESRFVDPLTEAILSLDVAREGKR